MRQAERAWLICLLGFVFVWYVTLTESIVLPFASLSIMSAMQSKLIHQRVETLMTPPSVWGHFFMLSIVSELLGIGLSAIAILHSGVSLAGSAGCSSPRWFWAL